MRFNGACHSRELPVNDVDSEPACLELLLDGSKFLLNPVVFTTTGYLETLDQFIAARLGVCDVDPQRRAMPEQWNEIRWYVRVLLDHGRLRGRVESERIGGHDDGAVG